VLPGDNCADFNDVYFDRGGRQRLDHTTTMEMPFINMRHHALRKFHITDKDWAAFHSMFDEVGFDVTSAARACS
jgi:hypothetical protein